MEKHDEKFIMIRQTINILTLSLSHAESIDHTKTHKTKTKFKKKSFYSEKKIVFIAGMQNKYKWPINSLVASARAKFQLQFYIVAKMYSINKKKINKKMI